MPADAAEIVRLAGRVEEATGPDRELDLAIHLILEPEGNVARVIARATKGLDGCSRFAWELRGGAVLYEQRNERGDCYSNGGYPVAAYTASLDAAMTLVDGVGVLLGLSDIGADGLPLARVGIPHLPDAPVFTGIASCIMTKTAPVAGLALAVTAAALKARARAAQHDHEVG